MKIFNLILKGGKKGGKRAGKAKALDRRRQYVADTSPALLTPPPDPLELFAEWLAAAENSNMQEPNAMHLATADARGRPHGRIVLLRQLYAAGPDSPLRTALPAFVFYTNYLSAKGMQLTAQNRVSLTFWWEELARQVRVEGKASKVSSRHADAYYASRPRGHRLGAWASPQSSVLKDPAELEASAAAAAKKFAGREVPRPKDWGGYAVAADYFEFWQGAPNRLHRRLCYMGQRGNWQTRYLAP